MADDDAPPATAKKVLTDYLILFYNEEAGGTWEEGPDIKARTPRKAIEHVLELAKANEDEAPVKFVAIPKRYWVVQEPGLETQTRIVWK